MFFTPFTAFPAVPAAVGAVADGSVSAPAFAATAAALFAAAVVATAIGQMVVATLRRERRARPHLRLVPTANAWGLSERATLDESAVGL